MVTKYFRAECAFGRLRFRRASEKRIAGGMVNRGSRKLGFCRAFVQALIFTIVVAVPVVGLALQVPAQSAAALAHERGDISGDWQGTLEFPSSNGRPGAKYRLVLRVAKAPGGGWTALNYSIDQGPAPMHTAAVTLQVNTFKYSIPSLNGSYEGQLSADGNSIKGTWTQGASSPLNFVRATRETAWEIPAAVVPTKPMAADADPSFAVATIKPSDPSSRAQTKIIRVYGRRYVTQNTSLADLIEVAYGVHPKQIVGGPAWVADDKFDLVGVPDGEGEPGGKQWLMMVQKLLADRFKFVFHHENNELSVYVLSVGKNGPKNLTKSPSANSSPSGLEFIPSADGLLLPAQNTTLGQFCQMMQQVVLDRPVIDQTGVAGKFDFQLRFTPDDSQFNGHPPRVPPQTDTPGLFEALQQQLGLKLAPGKAPVDVLVIDQVEKPSEN
jgi:uncharacterized protein (TIGR03435 family)